MKREIDLIGASAPVGFFDPLNLSKGKDAETLNWYRAAELKHGRISMIATLGVLVQGLNTGIIPNPSFQETNMLEAVKKVHFKLQLTENKLSLPHDCLTTPKEIISSESLSAIGKLYCFAKTAVLIRRKK